MSTLVKETDDYLEVVQYLHSNNDSFSDWEIDKVGKLKYSDIIQLAEHYACYEVKVTYRIDKNTGEVTYVSYDQ